MNTTGPVFVADYASDFNRVDELLPWNVAEILQPVQLAAA